MAPHPRDDNHAREDDRRPPSTTGTRLIGALHAAEAEAVHRGQWARAAETCERIIVLEDHLATLAAPPGPDEPGPGAPADVREVR